MLDNVAAAAYGAVHGRAGSNMKVGVIGAGRIGGNAARLLAAAGHEVMLSFSRDEAKLARTAEQIGARAGAPGEAAEFGEVIVFSVPWPVIGEALAQAGSLRGKIVIDTTNQFAAGGIGPVPAGTTAAQFNQARMPGARLVKALNTLTASFQAESAGRTGPDRVVMFLCGDHEDAKTIVAGLIDDAGFAPVDLGGLADAAPMEAPRRPGAVYGEEYHLPAARAFVASLKRGS